MLIPVNKEMLQAEFSAWYMSQCSPKKDCSRTPPKKQLFGSSMTAFFLIWSQYGEITYGLRIIQCSLALIKTKTRRKTQGFYDKPTAKGAAEQDFGSHLQGCPKVLTSPWTQLLLKFSGSPALQQKPWHRVLCPGFFHICSLQKAF